MLDCSAEDSAAGPDSRGSAVRIILPVAVGSTFGSEQGPRSS